MQYLELANLVSRLPNLRKKKQTKIALYNLFPCFHSFSVYSVSDGSTGFTCWISFCQASQPVPRPLAGAHLNLLLCTFLSFLLLFQLRAVYFAIHRNVCCKKRKETLSGFKLNVILVSELCLLLLAVGNLSANRSTTHYWQSANSVEYNVFVAFSISVLFPTDLDKHNNIVLPVNHFQYNLLLGFDYYKLQLFFLWWWIGFVKK